jgi:hypothetical protein
MLALPVVVDDKTSSTDPSIVSYSASI